MGDEEMCRRPNGGVQRRRVRAGTWTDDKRAAFLAAVACSANVRQSARGVGMSEAGGLRARLEATLTQMHVRLTVLDERR